MQVQELSAETSPAILEELLALYASECRDQARTALQDGSTKRLEKLLKADPLKSICRMFSWIYALDIPSNILKQQAAETLTTNWMKCMTSRSRWSVPINGDANLTSAYLTLAKKYNVSWVSYTIDKTQTNFIPYRQMIFHSSLTTSFSPYYDVVAHIALFTLAAKSGVNKTLTLELPDEISRYLCKNDKACIIMYMFHEVLGNSSFPALQIVSWENIKAAASNLSIGVNGCRVLLTSFKSANQIQMLKVKEPHIVPNAIDITGPIKKASKETPCRYTYIDLNLAVNLAHPDISSGTHKYQSTYISFYLAKVLTTEEMYVALLKKPMLTNTKLKQILVDKEDRYDKQFRTLIADVCYISLATEGAVAKIEDFAPCLASYRDFIANIRTVSSSVAQSDEYESDIEVADELLYLESHFSRKKVQIPLRSSNCRHFNRIMDLEEYIQTTKESNLWNCTVCGEPATFSQLHIDAFAWFLINIAKVGQTVVHLDIASGEFRAEEHGEDAGENSPPSGWSLGDD